MKTKLLLVLLFIAAIKANSQTVDKSVYDNVYYFVTSANLTQCDGDGENHGTAQNFNQGEQFKITKIITTTTTKGAMAGDFVIRMLEKDSTRTPAIPNPETYNSLKVFKSTIGTIQPNNQRQDSSGNTPKNSTPPRANSETYIYFYLPASIFTNSCDIVIKRTSFSLGVLTLPIKIRPGQKNSNGTYRDFSFENDISIGLSFGVRFAPNNHNAFNILTGIDLTSVPVSPETTNMVVASPTTQSAITWHLGFLYQIDNFQIGAFTGIDYLAGNVGRQWMYRNDMWLGVGIGYSIFAPKKTSETQ